jgi:hypothetical protein
VGLPVAGGGLSGAAEAPGPVTHTTNASIRDGQPPAECLSAATRNAVSSECRR